MANSYTQAMNYEIFMCRAYGTYDTSKPGLHMSCMQNLIDAENGKVWVGHLPSAEKQLVQVKKYLDIGFDKFIAKRKMDDQKFPLILLKQKASNSLCALDLLNIINQVLILTHDLK